MAALRYRKFFSIEELNQAIRELRDRINQGPFRKGMYSLLREVEWIGHFCFDHALFGPMIASTCSRLNLFNPTILA